MPSMMRSELNQSTAARCIVDSIPRTFSLSFRYDALRTENNVPLGSAQQFVDNEDDDGDDEEDDGEDLP